MHLALLSQGILCNNGWLQVCAHMPQLGGLGRSGRKSAAAPIRKSNIPDLSGKLLQRESGNSQLATLQDLSVTLPRNLDNITISQTFDMENRLLANFVLPSHFLPEGETRPSTMER